MTARQKRLEALTNNELFAGLGAMIELKEEYQGKREYEYCFLCMVFRDCHHCPWVVIADRPCGDEHDDIVNLRKSKNKPWAKKRIKELTIWIEIYKAEKTRRENP